MTQVVQIKPDTVPDTPPEGTRRVIAGEERVFYDGYWIKTYPVPDDTLEAKKRLIEALTRRLFNHTEHGLNVPGTRLSEARQCYQAETDTARQRVKGAMLAGSLFNRATDIFRKLVELQAAGVEIHSDDALMRECGKCLLEAMELGRLVLHCSGEEGIDELWGEPFRAFSIPLEDFFESRYIKIGQTLRDIDRIGEAMIANFTPQVLPVGTLKHSLICSGRSRLHVTQYRIDDHLSLSRHVVPFPQVHFEDGVPSVTVGNADEAERRDQQVQVPGIDSWPENAVTFAAFEQRANGLDGDRVALHQRWAPGDMPRALHVFDADQANMFGMRGVVVESDLDQPLHGALRRQIIKM